MLPDIKSILIALTAVRDEAEAVSALPYGLSLAAAAGAHASVRCAAVRIILPSGYIYDAGADLLAGENERLKDIAARTAAAAETQARLAGVAADVRTDLLLYDDVAQSFVEAARSRDLSIVDAGIGLADIDRGLVESLIFDSGRPLVVVPRGSDRFRGERIVVAWDGSARAARAVHDALPFLKAASDVRIVTISGEKDLAGSVPGADIAAHLARHGLAVTLASLPVGRDGAGATLRQYAEEQKADMVVMGAYAHSRLWQFVLGGVTRTMLEDAPVPILMSY